VNWFVLIVFVIMPLIGAIFALRAWRLTRAGIRAQATIIDYKRQESNFADWPSLYRPVVSFVDEKRKKHTVTLPNVVRRLPSASIQIIYPRGKPQKAQLASLSSIWLLPFWFCGTAITIIVFIGSHWIWYKLFG